MDTPQDAPVATAGEIEALREEVWRLRRELDDSEHKIERFRALEAQLQMTQAQTVEAIVGAIEAKDPYTSGHSSRVEKLSLLIGAALKLDTNRLLKLRIAALLHDVGKIGVVDSSLLKPSRLNDEEFTQLKAHPVIGERIISKIDQLSDVASIVRWHHERFDGRGYPDGLKGDEIPIESAIVCVADTYDAITSKRTYKSARPTHEALSEIERNSGTQFNPVVVRALRVALRPNELPSIQLDEGDFAFDFQIPDDPGQINQNVA